MDVDSESLVEMKTEGVNILDVVKQAILLFVNSKLSINPDHRFAFATLSKFTYWHIKEFSSDFDSTIAVVRALSATIVSSSQLDLTNLFRLAAHEAKKSHSQNRILRVVVGTAKMNAVIKVFAIMSLVNVDAFMDLVVLRYQNRVQNLCFTFLFVLRAVTKVSSINTSTINGICRNTENLFLEKAPVVHYYRNFRKFEMKLVKVIKRDKMLLQIEQKCSIKSISSSDLV
ncbi:hypothetical protein V6N11_021776 [Hibiscus sabdariffa]|uniref:Uncharacterized protein n=1 Tax=Hibiscus sabdariffa TaxID=183260 RepID=A0ABR2TH96_9ROSI